MKTLPKSLSRLVALERLDIGNNDFSELPDVIGTLGSLLELWCDMNKITAIPGVSESDSQMISHLIYISNQ